MNHSQATMSETVGSLPVGGIVPVDASRSPVSVCADTSSVSVHLATFVSVFRVSLALFSLCLLSLLWLPLLIVVAVLKVVSFVFGTVLDMTIRLSLWLLVKYIYPSRLGYLHVWFLKPSGRSSGKSSRNFLRNWKYQVGKKAAQPGQAYIGSSAQSQNPVSDSVINDPAGTTTRDTGNAPLVTQLDAVDGSATDADTGLRLFRKPKRRRRFFHSRITRCDTITAGGTRIAIHTIPCLADNYAYLVISLPQESSSCRATSAALYGRGQAPRPSASDHVEHSLQNGSNSKGVVIRGKVQETLHVAVGPYTPRPRALTTDIELPSDKTNLKPAPSNTGSEGTKSVAFPLERELSLPSLPTQCYPTPVPLRAVVIDACESDAILRALVRLSTSCYGGRQIVVDAVLTTHHHWDHQGGNRGLMKKYASKRTETEGPFRVYGSRMEHVDCVTDTVKHDDVISVGCLQFHVIEVPCHTRGSLIFKLKAAPGYSDCVFTGDTMFLGGCGAPFEGSEREMERNFWTIQRYCHPSSMLFPGHEYTVRLLWDILSCTSVCPMRSPRAFFTLCGAFFRAVHLRQFAVPIPTVPYMLQEELQYNPNFKPVRQVAKLLRRTLRIQSRFRNVFIDTPSRHNVPACNFPVVPRHHENSQLTPVTSAPNGYRSTVLSTCPLVPGIPSNSNVLFFVFPTKASSTGSGTDIWPSMRDLPRAGVPSTCPTLETTSHEMSVSQRPIAVAQMERLRNDGRPWNADLIGHVQETELSTYNRDSVPETPGELPKQFIQEPTHAREADTFVGSVRPSEQLQKLVRASAVQSLMCRGPLEPPFIVSSYNGTSPVTVIWTQELLTLLDELAQCSSGLTVQSVASRLQKFLEPNYLDQEHHDYRSHYRRSLGLELNVSTGTATGNVTPEENASHTPSFRSEDLSLLIKEEERYSDPVGEHKEGNTCRPLQKPELHPAYRLLVKKLASALDIISQKPLESKTKKRYGVCLHPSRYCCFCARRRHPSQSPSTGAAEKAENGSSTEDDPSCRIACSDFLFLLANVGGSDCFTLQQAQGCWVILCNAYSAISRPSNNLANNSLTANVTVPALGLTSSPNTAASADIECDISTLPSLPFDFLVQQLALSAQPCSLQRKTSTTSIDERQTGNNDKYPVNDEQYKTKNENCKTNCDLSTNGSRRTGTRPDNTPSPVMSLQPVVPSNAIPPNVALMRRRHHNMAACNICRQSPSPALSRIRCP